MCTWHMVDLTTGQKSRDFHAAQPNGNFSVLIHSFIPDLLIAWHLTDRGSLLETPLPSSFHSTAFSHSTLPATSCVSFKGF